MYLIVTHADTLTQTKNFCWNFMSRQTIALTQCSTSNFCSLFAKTSKKKKQHKNLLDFLLDFRGFIMCRVLLFSTLLALSIYFPACKSSMSSCKILGKIITFASPQNAIVNMQNENLIISKFNRIVNFYATQLQNKTKSKSYENKLNSAWICKPQQQQLLRMH